MIGIGEGDPVAIRTAVGGFTAMRPASPLAASSNSASGTTRDTNPQARASAADSMSPVNAISHAFE